jgi:hypothetical protein
MAVCTLLSSADKDTVGGDVALRVVGTREPPANMVVQIAIQGPGNVQIQARISRDAPWQNVGPLHSTSALFHIGAVQFLRAVASDVRAGTKVSVWADWAW